MGRIRFDALHVMPPTDVWAILVGLSTPPTPGHQERDQDDGEGEAQQQSRQAIPNLPPTGQGFVLRGHM